MCRITVPDYGGISVITIVEVLHAQKVFHFLGDEVSLERGWLCRLCGMSFLYSGLVLLLTLFLIYVLGIHGQMGRPGIHPIHLVETAMFGPFPNMLYPEYYGMVTCVHHRCGRESPLCTVLYLQSLVL